VSTLGVIAWWLLLGGLLGWLASWLVGRLMRSPMPAPVDEAAYRSRISALQNDVAVLVAASQRTAGDCRRRIAELEDELAAVRAAPVRVEERRVEVPVERVVERLVPDLRGLEERDAQLRALRLRLDHLEPLVEVQRGSLAEHGATLARLDGRLAECTARLAERNVALERLRREADVDVAAARAAGFAVTRADDLEVIEGIDPKIATLLRAEGITGFRLLSQTPPAQLRALLDQAGPARRTADPESWPEQADLAARNRWHSLAALQNALYAGVQPDRRGSIGAPQTRLAGTDAALPAPEAEIARNAGPAPAAPSSATVPAPPDREAARAAGFSVKGHGDLEAIEGIGPRIAELLRAQGIDSFQVLARTPVARLHAILDQAGPSFRMADPATWPEQSALAAFDQWAALRTLQDSLNAGRR